MDQSHFLWHIGERPEGCHHRPRRCLLKGCERLFWPRHPQSRYCSEACQQAARRWRRWQASQQYRATEQWPGAAARTRRGGIGSGGASGKRRQLTRKRRARASAQRQRAKIFRRGRAIGRVATNFSRFRMNIRASVFAAWRAAWLCVACWIAKSRYRARRRRLRCERVTKRARPPDTS